MRILRSSLLVLVMLCLGSLAFADGIKVASIDELQTAIDKAKPGDVITLANGVYTTNGDIKIFCKGTKDQRITICAETIGQAEIAGMGGFMIQSGAKYITIKGFKFTHRSMHAKTLGGSSFCRWSQNIFENTGDGEDLTIAGSDHEVDYNTFQNKNAMGRMLAMRGTGSQITERLWVHHNYFNNYISQGGKNGAETLQFGLSGFSLSTSNSIVEYNLFENCAGEDELISVKASDVTLRYNTIRNCPAQFTLRHGNKSIVYGNYFINTPGIRIFGDDHIIAGNYFENCKPAITIGNGDGEVADGAPLTSHDRPDRTMILNNTLINNPKNYVMTTRANGMGATYTTFAGNIINGGGPASALSGTYTNPTWKANILVKVESPGDMPATGYSIVNLNLVKVTGDFYIPVASSNLYYPILKISAKGEMEKGPNINYVLTTADVGYKAVK